MKLRSCILFVLVSFISFKLNAAAPMMHIVLGERWLTIFGSDYTPEEKKLFLLGTVFPDIRYLGAIKKERTHFKGMTLQKVHQGISPFEKGMLFHSFVDEFRHKVIHQSAIEKNIKEVPRKLQGTFLKLVEDEVLFNQYNWNSFKLTLINIPQEEKNFNIEEHYLTKWHTGLALYFSASPSLLLTQLSFLEKPLFTLDATTVKLWSLLVSEYAQKEVMQQHVKKLIKAFDDALEKSNRNI